MYKANDLITRKDLIGITGCIFAGWALVVFFLSCIPQLAGGDMLFAPTAFWISQGCGIITGVYMATGYVKDHVYDTVSIIVVLFSIAIGAVGLLTILTCKLASSTYFRKPG